MILNDDTRCFACTACRHTGQPCADALRMARSLGKALATAGPLLAPRFQIEGEGSLACAARRCGARFVASARAVYVFCDPGAGTAAEALTSLADALLAEPGEGGPTPSLGPLDPQPSAMVVGTERQTPASRGKGRGATSARRSAKAAQWS